VPATLTANILKVLFSLRDNPLLAAGSACRKREGASRVAMPDRRIRIFVT
jgi:hypothetical protein